MVGFFEPKAFILEGRAEPNRCSISRAGVDAGRLLAIEGSENLAGLPYEEALDRSSPDDFDVGSGK
jgi:hypothetical protein